MKIWELWYADFPYEDKSFSKDRPVIVLNTNPLCVLSIKVTSQDVRDKDKYDTPIDHWQEAGLTKPSVARISKTMSLDADRFRRKIGDLHKDDIPIIANTYLRFLFDTKQIEIEKEIKTDNDNPLVSTAVNE